MWVYVQLELAINCVNDKQKKSDNAVLLNVESAHDTKLRRLMTSKATRKKVEFGPRTADTLERQRGGSLKGENTC
jgi:hypothetical protein